jgi:hypothetical protein
LLRSSSGRHTCDAGRAKSSSRKRRNARATRSSDSATDAASATYRDSSSSAAPFAAALDHGDVAVAEPRDRVTQVMWFFFSLLMGFRFVDAAANTGRTQTAFAKSRTAERNNEREKRRATMTNADHTDKRRTYRDDFERKNLGRRTCRRD